MEARTPGLRHHMDLNARNPVFVASKQQSHIANNKVTDQPAHPRSLISAFIFHYLKSKVTR